MWTTKGKIHEWSQISYMKTDKKKWNNYLCLMKYTNQENKTMVKVEKSEKKNDAPKAIQSE